MFEENLRSFLHLFCTVVEPYLYIFVPISVSEGARNLYQKREHRDMSLDSDMSEMQYPNLPVIHYPSGMILYQMQVIIHHGIPAMRLSEGEIFRLMRA